MVPQVADHTSPSHQPKPASTSGSSLPASTAPPSRTGSGATTPVRKVSVNEFELGGLSKPIVNTIDGTQTFISDCPATCTSTSGPVRTGGASLHPGPVRQQRRSRHELRQLDEKELIFELVRYALVLCPNWKLHFYSICFLYDNLFDLFVVCVLARIRSWHFCNMRQISVRWPNPFGYVDGGILPRGIFGYASNDEYYVICYCCFCVVGG